MGAILALIPIAVSGIESVVQAILAIKNAGGQVIDLSTLTVVSPADMLLKLGISEDEIQKILAGQADITPKT